MLERGAPDASPVPVSEPVEAIASTDAPVTTEALKTAPVESLPLTTGKLPVSLPAVSKPEVSEAGGDSAANTGTQEVSVPPRQKSVPWDEEDTPVAPVKVLRLIHEIMEQEGVDEVEAAEIYAAEEIEFTRSLEEDSRRAKERQAKERKFADLTDKSKRASKQAFLFLALTLACVAGFFLMGGF